jgi:hypothetical protein
LNARSSAVTAALDPLRRLIEAHVLAAAPAWRRQCAAEARRKDGRYGLKVWVLKLR